MNGASWALLVLTGGLAVGDWRAVASDHRRAEYVLKPATMVALLGVALTVDPADASQRPWFVAAVALSLVGDVFLMLPSDRFVAGLASFLVAHVAYIVGLGVAVEEEGAVIVGLAVVAVTLVLIGPRIVLPVYDDHPELLKPVVAYMTVISAMVVAAFGTWQLAAVVGAVLFYGSDATIAWNRFVAPVPSARVVIMVTYHLGQIALVLSLT